jgi:phosphoglucosamine mutase
MRAGGYNLGGEQSGHIVMSDYADTGDGLIGRAADSWHCIVGKRRHGEPAVRCFDPVPQVLKNMRYAADSASRSSRTASSARPIAAREGACRPRPAA